MRRRSVRVVSLALVMAVALLAPATGLTHPQQQRPAGQIPDRGRPTESSDEIPLFDYDAYFPGTWEFEWRVPESPLGAGGMIEGTEVYATSEDGRYYTSRIDARGPDGTPSRSSPESCIWPPRRCSPATIPTVEDSISSERVGWAAISGGFYTIHYETPPFEVNGEQVQLRMTTRMVSPVNYRVQARISIDGGPFTNFGNAWWTKNVPGVTTPQ